MSDSNRDSESGSEISVSPISRRTILANGGLIIGTSTIAAQSSQGAREREPLSDFNQHLDRAFDLERRVGKGAMVEFLESKGYGVANKDIEIKAEIGGYEPEVKDHPISPEDIEDPRENGIKARLTGVREPYENVYLVSIRIELWLDEVDIPRWTCVRNSTGEAPIDLASLGWNTPREKYWELYSTDRISDFAYVNSDYSSLPGGNEWSTDAVGFKYDDAEAHADWVDDNTGWLGNCADEQEYHDLGRVGVKLVPAGSHPRSEREVYGSYEHTWSKSTNNLGVGFGISPAGPVISGSLTPEDEVESIVTTTETDGDTILKLTQDEMSTCC